MGIGTGATALELYVLERLPFTDDDRKYCEGAADLIMELATVARRDGMLELERRIPAIENVFLQKGVQLAVDAVHSDILYEILQNEIIYGGYSGKELLERIIFLEGVTSISEGESMYLIKAKLSAYLNKNLNNK